MRAKDALTTVLRSRARNRVIRKHLPGDLGGGAVYCSPDAILSTWKPGWRSTQAVQLFEWARRYVNPGDVVWDVGANQGLFAFAALSASAPSGHVVAFEPDPFLASLLQRSRSAQTVQSRIDILPLAVSGRTSLAPFSVASKDRALNHLSALPGNPRAGGERDRLLVMTTTLEWLATNLPPPHVIKIDVEGGEADVLQGAGDVLLTHVRPRWIVEVAAEHSAQIASILREADYRLFDANRPDCELTSPVWNTLAVPAESL